MANQDIHKRLDDLKDSLEKHFEQDAQGFGRLFDKLDKMDDKLDKILLQTR